MTLSGRRAIYLCVDRPQTSETQSTQSPRSLRVLTRRADFLAANRGMRAVTPGFILLVHPNNGAQNMGPVSGPVSDQASASNSGLNTDHASAQNAAPPSTPTPTSPPSISPASHNPAPITLVERYGITVSKRVGNAVTRNRMKRRFRHLLRAILPEKALPGHDHILIGREQGVERDFQRLSQDLEAALARLAAGKGDKSRGRGTRGGRGAKGKRGPKSGAKTAKPSQMRGLSASGASKPPKGGA